MIDRQEQLDELVARLEGEREIAIDCEMDSMYAYRTSLCLVQLGWDGGEALIDAMVPLDRAGLGRLFADPGRVKVFHGGENDVGLMRAQWGLQFESIFDTMATSLVLGVEGVGLAALLQRHFGVHVSKKFQKADWRVRPLPEAQAEYARLDVRYLLPLRRILLEGLVETGRVEEAESEFRRIGRALAEDKPFDPANWVRIRGARELPPERRAVLREVFTVRDDIARELDRAPYRVLSESTLVDIAAALPDGVGALRRINGVSRHLRPDHLDRLAAAVKAGAEAGEIPFPKGMGRRPGPGERAGSGPLPPEDVALFDALRAWRSKRAAARGVEVARVATNALLMAIVRARPAGLEALAAVDGMEDWRLREYAEDILAVVRNGKA